MGYPSDDTFEAARENRAPPAQRKAAKAAVRGRAPSLVYVVCCAPYAEKVVGGLMSVTQAPPRADGTFFLDYENARKASMRLNREYGTEGPCWVVYPALISVNPECADCGGTMAHHDDPDEHSPCKEFKIQ